MTSQTSIQKFLGISDENISFPNGLEPVIVKRNGVDCKQIDGVLTYTPTKCECCGCKNENREVIKHGTKVCHILFGDINYHQTILRLKKQRFYCRNCNATFMAKTTLVEKNCQISNIKNQKITELLMEEMSMSTIAKQVGVSVNTIIRRVNKLSSKLRKPKSLPEVLCIDEFSRAGRKMDFLMVDGETHRIIDIIPGRTNRVIEAYFLRFDYSVRKQVKYVVMDMYQPYHGLFKYLFPNAQIITDIFHVVQHLNRCLNQVRIQVMNNLRKTNKRDYRKLKSLWKLILKNREELNFEERKYNRLFGALVTEKEMVNYMINLDSSLLQVYELVNDLKYSIAEKNPEDFLNDLAESKKQTLKRKVRTTINTISSYKDSICLALETGYTNGPTEGLNTRIKNIKRSGYGYRNFSHLRARILIMVNSKDIKVKKNFEVA